MVVLREEIGDLLRGARQRQGRTLRDVSSTARVSLGYLSEVERGQKEASSELLLSICDALDVPMSSVLRSVSDRVAMSESLSARLAERLPAERVPTGRAGDRMTGGRMTGDRMTGDRLTGGRMTGDPTTGDRLPARAVSGIRKTVIRAPLRAGDDLAPVA